MDDYRTHLLDGAATPYVQFWARLIVRLRRPTIVGITGSAGKTTTKEVVAAVLQHPDARATLGDVWKTPGNMNNDDGVPLAVLGYEHFPTSKREFVRWLVRMPLRVIAYLTGVKRYPRVLVLEYAAGNHGHVERLVAIAPVRIGIVTTVGPAHLDRFGSVAGVAAAKGALVRALPPDGLAVLGADSPHTVAMATTTRARSVLVPGRGRAFADAAARIVAQALGVPDRVIESALAEPVEVPGRQQIVATDTLTIVDDAYNANPLSMRYALDLLAGEASPGRRRVAVLGAMGELGADAPAHHAELGRYARERADLVVGVGEPARAYEPDVWYPTPAACIAGLPELLRTGDYVLVKGSNATKLRQVALALRDVSPRARVTE